MKKMITGYFINPDQKENGSRSVLDKLENWYKLLDCSTIDIVTRKVGKRTFDIICDDEGLFRDKPWISAVDHDYHPALVGRLFLCHHDEAGNLTSLEPDDVEYIAKHVQYMFSDKHPELYPLLYPVTY